MNMMTSSNGNIFRVTGHLCEEFTGDRWSPHKGQWRGALMFSLICVWINGWVNNREAGDLRRYRAHHDVTVMKKIHRKISESLEAVRLDVKMFTPLWNLTGGSALKLLIHLLSFKLYIENPTNKSLGFEISRDFMMTHYSDVIITSLTIVYSTVYSGADQRKHQSSASLAFVRGIHRWRVNSPHKWPVTRKMLPFDDVIMTRDHPTL